MKKIKAVFEEPKPTMNLIMVNNGRCVFKRDAYSSHFFLKGNKQTYGGHTDPKVTVVLSGGGGFASEQNRLEFSFPTEEECFALMDEITLKLSGGNEINNLNGGAKGYCHE